MFIGTDAPGYAAVAEGKPYIIVPQNCDIMLVIVSMNFCSLSSIRLSFPPFHLALSQPAHTSLFPLPVQLTRLSPKRSLPSLHAECLSLFFFSFWALECHLPHCREMAVDCWQKALA